MAGQRPGLVDGTDRRDEVHEVGPAAVGADRHAAADDLAERREVGPDAEARLGAAGTDAEAGDHLVEDEQRAVGPGRLAEVLRKPATGAMTPTFAATGSTMTAAIRPGCSANASVTDDGSL